MLTTTVSSAVPSAGANTKDATSARFADSRRWSPSSLAARKTARPSPCSARRHASIPSDVIARSCGDESSRSARRPRSTNAGVGRLRGCRLPAGELGAKHGEAHGAVRQHLIVKGADVEGSTEASFRLLAKGENLTLSELVSERLRRPTDVAIYLVLDVVLGQRRVLEHVADGLLSAPPFDVQTGVDDQSARAPGVEAQHSHDVEIAGVKAHLARE